MSSITLVGALQLISFFTFSGVVLFDGMLSSVIFLLDSCCGSGH